MTDRQTSTKNLHDSEPSMQGASDPIEAAKRINFTRRRIGVGAATIGAITAGGFGIHAAGELIHNAAEANDMKVIANEVISIPQNGNLIGEVENTVDSIALEAKIDPSNIPTSMVVSESQAAAGANSEITGRTVEMPGDEFVVTVEANAHDNMSVEVTPLQEKDPSDQQ